MKLTFLVIFCLGVAAAADVPGVVLYKSADLKGMEKKLAAKLGSANSASETLDKFGNHLTMVAHREGDGSAELHETQADFFVVESGEATFGGRRHAERGEDDGSQRNARQFDQREARSTS